MNSTSIKKIFLLATFIILTSQSFSQVESSSFILNRGQLWQTVSLGKVGPSFSNWTQRGIGLDWPGYDASLISENIGGTASHLVSGGFYIGAKWAQDSILSVEEWSLYGSSVAEGAASKYTVTTNRKVYPNGENFWLKTNPDVGEEVVETVWEYNVNYQDEFQIKRMLPVRVKRTTHQWSGSRKDENYIIHDYVIKNISPEIRAVVSPERFVADSLLDVYITLNYGMHSNSRSWSVLFPSLSPGARNTWFFNTASKRLIFGYAADYPDTKNQTETFGLVNSFGPIVNDQPSGEYLAPAYVGYKLLYASPNKLNEVSKVNRYGWSAASNSIDLSGPFTNLGSLEAQYAAMQDIRLTSSFVSSFTDTVYMRRSRMWSMMSLGPWDILPGDSIRFAVAEIVNGVDYGIAIQPKNYGTATITSLSRGLFDRSVDQSQFTFDNNFNHPDPPAAPEFTVDYNRGGDFVANILNWGMEAESIPDPDDGQLDLVGYIVYRSEYLSIGPWIAIDTVFAGDINYLDGFEYTYIDSAVSIGQGYYYALTSFDNGRASWTGVQTITNVPPLETSIFANRKQTPFIATIAPKDNLDEVLVVPNPFIIGEGQSQPNAGDQIQFVNLPNPCTIRIYTVRGDIVKTIEVADGAGAIVQWDQVTDYGQFVESGIYIFHIDYKGGSKLGKFAIVR